MVRGPVASEVGRTSERKPLIGQGDAAQLGQADHSSDRWPAHPSVRWRAFADTVAAALGVNVWVTMVLLPGLFVGAWSSPSAVVTALLPLVVLAVGLWRRSDSVLLLGFPSALLVPTAIHVEIISPQVYGPWRFALVSVSVLAYLFGASFLSSFEEPPEPEAVRPLASSRTPVPVRWRRRFRVYAGLVILAIAMPAVLIYTVNFDSGIRSQLSHLFPTKVSGYTALLNLGTLGLWLLLYRWVFMGILRPHRVGDRDLVLELSVLKASARRGRPRAAFYISVAVALSLMLLLLALRYW